MKEYPSKEYNPAEIEAKWQERWATDRVFEVNNGEAPPGGSGESGKKQQQKIKKYVLCEFPYPSGDGLHVGHMKIYTATDVTARYLRMCGFDVLHPMGWDAFGLPTENSAIKYGVNPKALTAKNTARFREQMRAIGLSYDWSREINTTDPAYYRWTQWIFLQLFKKGLAYEATQPINWCPTCKTGLANEEVADGHCERCGHEVVQKPMRQWMLKITEYADQLLVGLEDLDWPENIKEIQRNWIGRSEGVRLKFDIQNSRLITAAKKIGAVDVFTTRMDTLFGATYLVLAPEHELVRKLLDGKVVRNADEVESYVRAAAGKTELTRRSEEKEKTGVELIDVQMVNPADGNEIPVWVADYVLMGYGTGAIMAVPAHDERDFAFAKKYDLPIKRVILGGGELPYTGEGGLVDSGEFGGMPSDEAKAEIAKYVGGTNEVNYKLRDWVFSRQRYWGEPIPVIHCDKCGVVAVPEDELPIELPEIENYEPTGTGESPLAAVEEWVNVECPRCGERAKRETNTMPQWAGSSWYWIRFVDPANAAALADEKKIRQWLPVDIYVGGAEHAVLHLLYGRFWNMVLHDIGAVNTVEPFKRRHIVGLVLGEDGQKMSKSKGNVVNPDDVMAKHGADAVRIYEMFMGPFENAMPWSDESLAGSARFLQRVWDLYEAVDVNVEEELSPQLDLKLHQTIKRVTEGTENFRFNTAIAALMELLNEVNKQVGISRELLETFLLMLAPYAPHMAEELWEMLGHKNFIANALWPKYDESKLVSDTVTLPVQVNGRVRGEVVVETGDEQAVVEAAAREVANVAKYLINDEVIKVVFVMDRMINFVTGSVPVELD